MKLLTAIWLIIVTCFMWMTPVVSMASNTTNANFYGVITAVSTNGTGTVTNQASQVSNINTSTLINAGYVNSAANNTAITDANGVDLAFQPGAGTNNWMVWVPSIAPNGIISDILYTGVVSGGKMAYFPSAAGMSTADSPSLEIGANFTIEQNGWFDTSAGASKYTIFKNNAFTIDSGTTGSGNITATIVSPIYKESLTSGVTANTFLAYGVNWVGQTFTASANYSVTGVTLQLYRTGSPGTINVLLYATVAGVPTGSSLASMSFDGNGLPLFGASILADYAFTTPYSLVSGTQYAIVVNDPTGDGVGNELGGIYDNANPYAGGTEVTSNNSGGAWVTVAANDLNFKTFMYPIVSSPVASGEHDLKVYADGTNLKMDVDSVNVASTPLSGASVPNNASNWLFVENGAMSYMIYHKITVGATLEQHIRWNYGATFTDLSGQGHNATPSFAVTSSDPHVTASLISFAPTSQAQAPGFSLNNAPNFITTTPGISSNFSSVNGTYTNPVVNVIAQVAAASNTPPELPILVLGMFFMLVISFVSGWAMRRFGVQSNLYKVGMYDCLLGIAIAIAPGAWNFWMLLFFSFIAIALTMGSKHYSW